MPDCFGIGAPWRDFVSDEDFERRVDLTDDQCVIDGKTFFVRGHIEIPIHGHPHPLSFSVWSSLSEKSFLHISDRWDAPDRESDAPYFGWLCSPIRIYPDAMHLKLSVQSREPGQTPSFTVMDDDHALAIDQRNGINIERWHQLALQLMALQQTQ